MYIYLLTNTVNGKQYVGQTTRNVDYRIRGHLWTSTNKRGYPLHKAIVKYGWANFTVDILTNCLNQEHLDAEELRLIAKLNTQVPNGYNLLAGGKGGGKHSEQTKKLFSEMRKGKGMPEACLKASRLALSTRVLSEETHKKLSEAQRGNTKALGKPRPDVVKEKIGVAQRGDKNHAAKLTWEIVNAIRDEYKNGISFPILETKYSTSHANVSRIVHYRSWVPEGMKPNTSLIKPKKENAVRLTWELVNAIREEYALGAKIIELL